MHLLLGCYFYCLQVCLSVIIGRMQDSLCPHFHSVLLSCIKVCQVSNWGCACMFSGLHMKQDRTSDVQCLGCDVGGYMHNHAPLQACVLACHVCVWAVWAVSQILCGQGILYLSEQAHRAVPFPNQAATIHFPK